MRAAASTSFGNASAAATNEGLSKICDRQKVRKCENVILGSRMSPCQTGESVPQPRKVIITKTKLMIIFMIVF